MRCPHCNGTGTMEAAAITAGDLILSHRKASGLTQQELASKVGLSRAQIANIEANRSDMPLSRFAKLADALGVSMKELIP